MLGVRKLHARGELLWWLALVAMAGALTGVLAREARGEEWDSLDTSRVAVWRAIDDQQE